MDKKTAYLWETNIFSNYFMLFLKFVPQKTETFKLIIKGSQKSNRTGVTWTCQSVPGWRWEKGWECEGEGGVRTK